MPLVDTFYWLELVRWSCNFKGVRKCRRASTIFSENSVSITRSMGKDPIRSGAEVLLLKCSPDVCGIKGNPSKIEVEEGKRSI